MVPASSAKPQRERGERREGWEPTLVPDPLYFCDGERYVPLDADLSEAIEAGRIALR